MDNFNFKFVIYFIVITSSPYGTTAVDEISYADQGKWANTWDQCGHNRQSPINLNYDQATSVSLPPLRYHNYNTTLVRHVQIKNVGHTADIKIPINGNNIPYITGGLLQGKYVVEGIHFHWGQNNVTGTEHSLEGYRLGLEMHIVHRNSKYQTVEIAREFNDGMAVVAVLFKVVKDSESHSVKMITIADSLRSISRVGLSTELGSQFDLLSMLPTHTTPFYTYEGSLTTPPCSQAVTWIVYANPVILPGQNVRQFRQLLDARGFQIRNNVRNLQRVGNRPVYYVDNFKKKI